MTPYLRSRIRPLLLCALVAVAAALVSGCTCFTCGDVPRAYDPDSPPATSRRADPDLARLARWLSGSFSSQEQALADPEFRDIRLHASIIWSQRHDGVWLYVEQAAADQQDAPYRQRIYHLMRANETQIESAVYLLPHPEKNVGAWKDQSLLGTLSPSDLTLREGCSVFLRFEDNRYIGRTPSDDCVSDLEGAAYAKSDVELDPLSLKSWDRGLNAEGTQVWGAETAYVFKRILQ